MIYRSLRNMRKKQLKLLHAGIHTTIVLLIIIAQVAVISFHNALGIPNFYSLHSWVGIVTMLIFFSQVIIYFTLAYFISYINIIFNLKFYLNLGIQLIDSHNWILECRWVLKDVFYSVLVRSSCLVKTWYVLTKKIKLNRSTLHYKYM